MHPFPVILMGGSYWSGLQEWMVGTCVPSGTLDARDLEALEITGDPEIVVARAPWPPC